MVVLIIIKNKEMGLGNNNFEGKSYSLKAMSKGEKVGFSVCDKESNWKETSFVKS